MHPYSYLCPVNNENCMKRLLMLMMIGCLTGLCSPRATAQPAGVVLDTLLVPYVDGRGTNHEGVIICNKSIAKDLTEIFTELYRAKYPIERIRPISEFGNDDEQSMQANNSSCYCYRKVQGSSKLSKHAQGLAIDINPLYNPCVTPQKGGSTLVEPATGAAYADRNAEFPYKITKGDLCYRLFIKHGFKWGGEWKSKKDYQHFER